MSYKIILQINNTASVYSLHKRQCVMALEKEHIKIKPYQSELLHSVLS